MLRDFVLERPFRVEPETCSDAMLLKDVRLVENDAFRVIIELNGERMWKKIAHPHPIFRGKLSRSAYV